MKGFSTKAYLAMGLSFLVASIVMASAFVGVLPDRAAAIREGRTALAELTAVNSTAAIVPEGAPRVEAMLKFMLERNKDLVSAGVRRADGVLVVAAGDHANTWKPLADDHSTDRQMQVPILTKSERWGQLELAFKPTGVPHLFGMEMPWLYLVALHVRLVLRRVLHVPRPHAAPPRRVARRPGARALGARHAGRRPAGDRQEAEHRAREPGVRDAHRRDAGDARRAPGVRARLARTRRHAAAEGKIPVGGGAARGDGAAEQHAPLHRPRRASCAPSAPTARRSWGRTEKRAAC